MTVVALDLGVLTGWAMSLEGRIESGVQEFALKRGESGGMRYIRFRRWLDELAVGAERRPMLWVYELAHHRGGYTTEVHNNLAGRVQEHCATLGYEYQAVHTATLKKWTTGNGRADKRAMAEAALGRWHAEVASPLDDNQIDALALLHYALEELVPST